MASLLDQIKQWTITVTDTGDINSIKKFLPRDATTNPSLITAAAQMPEYADVVDGGLRWAEEHAGAGASEEQVAKLRAHQAGPGPEAGPGGTDGAESG